MFKKNNNLDVIRLILALQVLLVHTFHHVDGLYIHWLEYLPGVPAFFFLSGLLIYGSYDNSKSISEYFKNRFFRLFPALFVVVIISSVWVYCHRVLNEQFDNSFILAWTLAQLTLGQAYNPSQLRDFGVGVFNGSLWTITVEILFYLAVPIIAYLSKRIPQLISGLTLLSFFIYIYGETLFTVEVALGKTLYDFFSLTPIVWGWMFGLGMLTYKYFNLIEGKIKYFVYAVVPLGIFIYLDIDSFLFRNNGNGLGILYFLSYIALLLFLAFEVKAFKLKIDLSYGLYIWHMPIINILLSIGLTDSSLAIIVTMLLALMSWFFIEKPCLKLKSSGLLVFLPK